MKRSMAKITRADLRKLHRLARADMDAFFERNLHYRAYSGKEALVALCQGAALHFLDGRNGVKDFDVWFFYPPMSFSLPPRRRGVVDFGASKFGKHPNSKGYIGRTVDVLMRSDSAFSGCSANEGIARYLERPRTTTARLLAEKAVVGLYPASVFGKVLWPTTKDGDFRGGNLIAS
jgi:hypothetical protein